MLSLCLELLSAFSGMERENTTRGLGWLFLSLGRRLERAIYLTRQLREISTPLSEQEWPFLECLLEVADSSMTYRSRYYTTLQPLAVLDVLMADESNPRSLDFQLTHLVDLYQRLPRHLPEDLQAMRDVRSPPPQFRSRKDQLSTSWRIQRVRERQLASSSLRAFSQVWNGSCLRGLTIYPAGISATRARLPISIGL